MSGCLGRLKQAVTSLHPDLSCRVKAKTLRLYSKTYNQFVTFVSETFGEELLEELSGALLDKFIMEYRAERNLSRSKQGLLLSSVEFFLPHFKGKMTICEESLKGRRIADPVNHMVPMIKTVALVFG